MDAILLEQQEKPKLLVPEGEFVRALISCQITLRNLDVFFLFYGP